MTRIGIEIPKIKTAFILSTSAGAILVNNKKSFNNFSLIYFLINDLLKMIIEPTY